MKILMLTPYLPYPPSSGGQVRSYNLIKNLSKKHEIYLMSLIKRDAEQEYVSHLKPYCKQIYVCKRSESPWTVNNIIKSVFGRYPLLVVRNFSPPALSTIAKLVADIDFDLIHAETFYIMPHIPKTDIPILLVEQTIEYRVYQHFVRKLFPLLKPFFYFDILKLRFWEKTYWQKADLVGAVSENDKKNMRELLPGLKIEVIPNAAGEDMVKIYKKDKKPKAIFLYQGNFYWLQNVEAAKILISRVFPMIKKELVDARCIIAGQNATAKLGRVDTDGIEVVDIPPSDIDKVLSVYEEASIFLAPIEGPGGTRLKILGAMAAGLPVISSKTGVSGLDITDGDEVLIADTPEDFAKKSIELLNNASKYQKIRQKARRLIEEKYNWPAVSEKLERIYLKLTREKQSS